LEKAPDCLLVGEVQFAMCSSDNVFIAPLAELSDNRRTDHAPVPCHVYTIILGSGLEVDKLQVYRCSSIVDMARNLAFISLGDAERRNERKQ